VSTVTVSGLDMALLTLIAIAVILICGVGVARAYRIDQRGPGSGRRRQQ
jgi:hypothetical protein